jgi:predicted RND superfamily exporter protein
LRSITSFHLKYWHAVILITLIACGISIPSTVKLFKTISTDPIDLLPKNNPNVQTLLNVREKLERGNRSRFVIESDDREANIRFINDLVTKLKAQPFIFIVEEKKAGFDFFDKHKLLFMEKKDLVTIRDRIDKKIQKEKLGGFYLDLDESDEDKFSFKDLEEKYASKYTKETTTAYNESVDGKLFSVIVESHPGDTSLAAASTFHDALDNFSKTLKPQDFHPTMKVYLAGATKVIEYRTLVKDLTKVGLISLILIFIPLLIRFRNPLYVFFMFFPLIISMPISFAVASQIVPRLNICTSFLFAILGGLGIENGIHIFSRYRETRKRGFKIEQALEEIYTKTGRAILTSVASVAITFLALAWNDFRGFSEFGIISGIGLIVIFAVYFIFMPSVLVAAEKFSLLRFKSKEEITEFNNSVWKIPQDWILIIGIAFTVLSFTAAPFLSFEYDAKATRADIPSAREITAKQRQTVKRVNSPAVVFINSQDEADQLKAVVEERIVDDKFSATMDTARSYYDLFPTDQKEKMKIISQIGNLLQDKTLRLINKADRKNIEKFQKIVKETEPVTEASLPEDLTHVFKGNPKVPGELFYINAIPTLDLDDGQNAMRFTEDVAKVTVGSHTYFPSSDAVVYGLVLKTMLKDAPRVIILSVLCIVFFVFLDFRKIPTTLLVVSPMLLGVIWMLGIMWLTNMRFNFFNIIIIPAVLGMSIDNSIHIFHRYKELGPGSLKRVLSSAGMAALLASLTNASAFVGLLFCNHRGLFSIGQLAVVGVSTCLLSSLVFFPAMLEFLEKIRFKSKRPFP